MARFSSLVSSSPARRTLLPRTGGLMFCDLLLLLQRCCADDASLQGSLKCCGEWRSVPHQTTCPDVRVRRPRGFRKCDRAAHRRRLPFSEASARTFSGRAIGEVVRRLATIEEGTHDRLLSFVSVRRKAWTTRLTFPIGVRKVSPSRGPAAGSHGRKPTPSRDPAADLSASKSPCRNIFPFFVHYPASASQSAGCWKG